jgi:Leucine-rich repeat (LRR) protein
VDDDLAPLQYCTDLDYLDLGHNKITDLSFVHNLPKAEGSDRRQ